MPEIRTDIKIQLRKCGKTMADLSRQTAIPYRRLAGGIQAYWYLRPEEEKRIQDILKRWIEAETMQTASISGVEKYHT